MFAIDLDHYPFTIKDAWNGMWDIGITKMERGFMHDPLIFYLMLSFTLGYGMHLMMDGII